MASHDNCRSIHLVAGGAAGTVGAVVTCPLEVVKTRLQSSCATFHHPAFKGSSGIPPVNLLTPHLKFSAHAVGVHGEVASCAHTRTLSATRGVHMARSPSAGLLHCISYIIKNEGWGGLFKGLGPNLVGVVPSRAIYFFVYTNCKNMCNQSFTTPETPLIHMISAIAAGVTACTATNPIWFVKTRLQLDQKRDNSLRASQCIRDIYATHGIPGFYKGITASYLGVSETVIKFVIYEAIKAHILGNDATSTNTWLDYVGFMFAGASAKITATCMTYPHEVVRTRLREEGNKYTGLKQTFSLVFREEGVRGLYRGLVTQLIRQIPNTALMMTTYELVVYTYFNWWKKKDSNG